MADHGLLRTFHYSVPLHLAQDLSPGHLVWVPFGKRQLAGVVFALSDSSPVEETKDILDIVDPRPVLTPYQLDLARWISEHYLAPLHGVAWSMFPSGVGWRAEALVELTSAGRELLSHGTSSQQTAVGSMEWSLLEAIGSGGPLSSTDLEVRWGSSGAARAVRKLVQDGLLRKKFEIHGPTLKPKTEAVVRVEALPTEADLSRLSRAHKQLDVLRQIRRLVEKEGRSLPLIVPVAELCQAAETSRSVINALATRGLLTIGEREVRRDPLEGREFVLTSAPKLTLDQEIAWQQIAAGLDSPNGQVYLLHGVTGSGKTEIYLKALARVLEEGGQAIVLVPEIALTPQTIRRFAARFPDRVAVLHSRLTAGERFDEWRRVRDGEADVVIGPQSAVFAPLPRLRLLIVDESHEWTYKHQETPRYHARAVAAKLAELIQAVVILGTATPDVETYYLAQRGRYQLLELPKRIMGHQGSIDDQRRRFHISAEKDRFRALGAGYGDARYAELPPVELVDLREELRSGNRSILSRSLQQSLTEVVRAGEQAILFLNRRGMATFVMCRDCGHVIRCPRCAVSLVYHSEGDALHCHHCNYRTAAPVACPECGSKRIKHFGVGTQRVEQVVQELIPGVRTLRWDRDVTAGKDAHQDLLDRFVAHQADVLIGTQMIAKGLDLPLVTLVGVVSADTGLQLPDFRASERTFQLLTQVAGRAGRSMLGGKVIVQTYAPDHYCIQTASHHDYAGFYEQELAFRRAQAYPPFSQLVRLLFLHQSARTCQQEAEELGKRLALRRGEVGSAVVDIIGPSPCFIARVRGRYRWHIILRGSNPVELLAGFPIPRGWRIDVDPVSVL